MASGNGSKPKKTLEQVAAELRERLESQVGRERAEEIWRDPAAVERVVTDDIEAAAVAETLMRAWTELPDEQPERRRGSSFRRGLQIALLAAVAVWSLSLLRKLGGGQSEGQ
jgi:hypothetical protein